MEKTTEEKSDTQKFREYNMKPRLSISIDQALFFQIRDLIRKEHFLKNKSQVVEYAIRDMLRMRKENA